MRALAPAGFAPRPYQVDQLLAISAALTTGTTRVVIKSPTGTGKTVMFSHLPAHLGTWYEQFDLPKMLVIAHREELLDQAAAKIEQANPGKLVLIEQGDRRAGPLADVVVASIQTLAAMKFRRLRALLEGMTFRIVVVDEAHHAAAASYRTALALLGFLPAKDMSDVENIEAATHDDVVEMEQALAGWDIVCPKDRLLVGVTATPNRSDAVGLGCVFQSIAYSYALKDAIKDGWLVPITPWVIETQESLDDVHQVAGDFNQKELAEAVNVARRNQLAVSSWLDLADGRPTLAFTVDVAHAHQLADEFRAQGVRAEAISGETPKEDRRRLLREFTAGTIDVLTNCMVLTEGTDLPRVSCILHAKPTKSATLYEQMTGRGLRLFPGKPDCIVIDLVDVARRHSLMAAPVLYGLPPGILVKGKQLDQVEAELELLQTKHGFNLEKALAAGRLTLEQLRAKATTFDIFQPAHLGAFGAGRAMNWLRTGEHVYRMSYPWADGIETLQVSQDLLARWEVTTTLRARTGELRQRTLVAGIPTEDEAAGLAEAFILAERRSVAAIKSKTAPWRSRPASAKQIALLQFKKVPVPKGCTMGQASDLIDQAMAKPRGRR